MVTKGCKAQVSFALLYLYYMSSLLFDEKDEPFDGGSAVVLHTTILFLPSGIQNGRWYPILFLSLLHVILVDNSKKNPGPIFRILNAPQNIIPTPEGRFR